MRSTRRERIIGFVIFIAIICTSCKSDECLRANGQGQVNEKSLANSYPMKQTARDLSGKKSNELIVDLKEIERDISAFKIENLSTSSRYVNDVEFRIWDYGGAYPPLHGIIFERKSNRWTVREIYSKGNSNNLDIRSIKEGNLSWDVFWSGLVELQLLKNESGTLQNKVEPFEDSTIVILETRVNNEYVNFAVHAPCLDKSIDGVRVAKILDYINQNFDLRFHPCEY